MYGSAGDLAALDAAIGELRRGLRQAPADGPLRGIVFAALGEAFGFRFALTSGVADLETAVAYGEQSVAVLPADDPQRGTALGKLAGHHLVRFEVTGDPADLDAQIGHAAAGLALTEAADRQRPLLRELLAAGHEHRYEQTGDAADLDAAIRCRETAADDRAGDAVRARNLSNLSFDQLQRHGVTGSPADLRGAVDNAAEAVEVAGRDSPDHAELLSKLGATHRARFIAGGDLTDLRRSVELAEQARDRAPADYRGTALVNLAVAYAERYEHAGDHHDLDLSVETNEEALAHPGLTRHQRGACAANLTVMYRKRYEHFGVQGDLDYAIQLGHRAVEALPDGHPEGATRLSGLASCYAELFDRDRDRADLDTAVDLGERAVATAGPKPPERRLLQCDLSGLLLRRFRENGNPADLDAAVGLGEQALGAVGEHDPQWARFAENLAGALLHRHRLGTRADLDRADLARAVDLIERAAALTRPDSPFLLDRLQNLAVAHQEQAVDPARRQEMVRRLITAVGTATVTTPTGLARTYTNIGRLALQAGLLADAAAMWGAAVELLPRCAPPGLGWSDQEHQLSGIGNLVGEATAAHLALGEVDRGVELAELGRGILLSNQLNARADLAALSRAAPALAGEFQALVAELDTRSVIGGRLHDLSHASALRRPPRQLADRWDRLLHRIRDVPELSGFLSPPRLAELRGAAVEGAVVLVNVGTAGGDAVVLRLDAAVRVPLPRLTVAEAEAYATALAGVEFFVENTVTKARATPPQGATQDLLAWLWEAVTGPVLTALGHDTPPSPGTPLPRVWWVATGPLSLLPLHAAGLPGGPTALDRVVSSYAPSIRALMLARRRGGGTARTQLIVTMRHTDGLPELPATAAETAHLLARTPDAVTLADHDATAAAVLSSLPQAGWVHFSCHATSHPEKASKSGLHLHDRTLRVPEISRAGLRNGELAYLSACSTGQGSLFQADEAIPLGSAFQLAGYRHVVATLWPINDQVAAMASRRFYRLLGDSPTADGAAGAVHEVTRRLRARFPEHPELWAPLIHSGP